MTTKEKTSRRASVRNSMEVKQGGQGLARMLRRGLHGAKGWVLEPEEDGSHRTVGSKAFRAAAVFLPGWIVLSAFTSKTVPEGSGGSTGSTLLMALLITLGGLAFFSARERRLGREEPWATADEEGKAEDSEAKTIPSEVKPEEELNGENTPVDLTKPQVTEVTTEDEVVTTGDNTGEKDHFDPPEAEAVTQVVTSPVTPPPPEYRPDEVFDQVNDGSEAFEEVVTGPVTPVVTPGEVEIAHQDISDFLEEKTPTVRTGGGHPPEEVVTPDPEEVVFPQVTEEEEVVTSLAEEAAPISLEKKVTTETRPEADKPVTPVVTKAVTPDLPNPVSPQVEAGSGAVTNAVTPVVTKAETLPFLAESGPYPVTKDSMTYDWWATPPDAPEKAVEPPAEDSSEETPEEAAPVVGVPLIEDQEEVEKAESEPEVEAGREPEIEPEIEPEADRTAQPEALALNYPKEVVTYLALKGMTNVARDEKERARAQVIAWVKREGAAGRSQREMAGMLGVSKTTVLKWLNGDPWAEEAGHPE